MTDLKPIAQDYLGRELSIRPGTRLHRLVARLCDSYIDDLTVERIDELERLADGFRVTHASGRSFGTQPWASDHG